MCNAVSFVSFIASYRVQPGGDPQHGKAWGKLVWKGRLKDKEERIKTGLKKEWKLLEFPDYQKFNGDAAEVLKSIPVPKA